MLATPACSKDPEKAKQEHLARGNEYAQQNKLAEAAIMMATAKGMMFTSRRSAVAYATARRSAPDVTCTSASEKSSHSPWASSVPRESA